MWLHRFGRRLQRTSISSMTQVHSASNRALHPSTSANKELLIHSEVTPRHRSTTMSRFRYLVRPPTVTNINPLTSRRARYSTSTANKSSHTNRVHHRRQISSRFISFHANSIDKTSRTSWSSTFTNRRPKPIPASAAAAFHTTEIKMVKDTETVIQ